MRLIDRRRFGIALAAATAAGVMSVPATAQNVSFAGKTVTLLHNTPPGSSVDVFARQVGPYVTKNLPGKPEFIVVAKPGGRFLLGASYFYKNVKPDGMSMGMMATLPGQYAAGNKMPIDITNFVQVGGMGQTYIYYVRKDFGLKSADELANLKKTIISGAGGPNTNSQLMWRMFMNAIGAKDHYRQIYGYRGQMGQLKAVRANEIHQGSMLGTLYLQLLPGLQKEGLVQHYYETGNVDDNGNAHPTPGLGVPTIESLWKKHSPQTVNSKEFRAYKTLLNSIRLTWQYVLPPGTPEAYAVAWDKAMAAAVQDPGFIADMKKAGTVIPDWVNRDATVKILNELKAASTSADYKAAIKTVFRRR